MANASLPSAFARQSSGGDSDLDLTDRRVDIVVGDGGNGDGLASGTAVSAGVTSGTVDGGTMKSSNYPSTGLNQHPHGHNNRGSFGSVVSIGNHEGFAGVGKGETHTLSDAIGGKIGGGRSNSGGNVVSGGFVGGGIRGSSPGLSVCGASDIRDGSGGVAGGSGGAGGGGSGGLLIIPGIADSIEWMLRDVGVDRYDENVVHLLIDVLQRETLAVLSDAADLADYHSASLSEFSSAPSTSSGRVEIESSDVDIAVEEYVAKNVIHLNANQENVELRLLANDILPPLASPSSSTVADQMNDGMSISGGGSHTSPATSLSLNLSAQTSSTSQAVPASPLHSSHTTQSSLPAYPCCMPPYLPADVNVATLLPSWGLKASLTKRKDTVASGSRESDVGDGICDETMNLLMNGNIDPFANDSSHPHHHHHSVDHSNSFVVESGQSTTDIGLDNFPNDSVSDLGVGAVGIMNNEGGVDAYDHNKKMTHNNGANDDGRRMMIMMTDSNACAGGDFAPGKNRFTFRENDCHNMNNLSGDGRKSKTFSVGGTTSSGVVNSHMELGSSNEAVSDVLDEAAMVEMNLNGSNIGDRAIGHDSVVDCGDIFDDGDFNGGG